jgi:hypothetical protein
MSEQAQWAARTCPECINPPRRPTELLLNGVDEMANEPTQNRMRYVLPWLGIAAIILAMWAAFGQ